MPLLPALPVALAPSIQVHWPHTMLTVDTAAAGIVPLALTT
jgi:hypothetical protein